MTHHFQFDAIGTAWTIDCTLEQLQPEVIYTSIQQTIETYDRVYSRFRTDSLVSQIKTQPGRYRFPPESQALFRLYHQLYQATGGLFTPLIGNLLSQAGYDQNYSLKPQQISPVPIWEDLLEWEYPYLTTKAPVELDTGAAAKGQLIDIIGNLLEQHAVTTYCVDAGGDIRYKTNDQTPIRIGLEHPTEFKLVIGVVELHNQSICGSAGNRRQWDIYHHIMNPKTKTSVQSVTAVWVIADTTLLADGLSTALFLVPPEQLLPQFQFDYLIVYPDFHWQQSTNFPGEIFTSAK